MAYIVVLLFALFATIALYGWKALQEMSQITELIGLIAADITTVLEKQAQEVINEKDKDEQIAALGEQITDLSAQLGVAQANAISPDDLQKLIDLHARLNPTA